MTLEEIRAHLKNKNLDREAAIKVFRAITHLVNTKSTHDHGREMVIRALEIRDSIPTDFIPLLNSLIQTVGLMPYLDPESRDTLEDFALYEAHKVPNMGDDFVLHTLQLQIYKLIISGTNVVLSATTSVGKSAIVDAVISSNKFRCIVIVVPTIALIDETRRRLISKFGRTHCIVTHQSQNREVGKPVLYVLTQERALVRDDLQDVEFFVIDEFYKLDIGNTYDERSIDLNLCFHKLANYGARFYLIGPHVHEIRGLAERYNHYFIPSQYTTVAVDIKQLNLPKSGNARKDEVVRLCGELKEPTLVYCQSPSKASEVAQVLLEAGSYPKIQETSDAVDWLRLHYPSEWIVIQALERGIALHHANVPRAIQQYAIRLFEEKIVNILICTSTIIEGVNTVAKNVIIYDKRIKTSNINYFTFKNIAGRAGRMGSHYVGKVFILEEPPEEDLQAVILPIEHQNEHTPLPLILDLPSGDLATISQQRIDDLMDGTPLSLETIKSNRHIPISIQNEIANILIHNSHLRHMLSWRGMPNGPQLRATCNLIYRAFNMRSMLKSYQIYDGDQLAACLTKIQYMSSTKDFITERLEYRRDGSTISDSVDDTLRFLRKYVGYKLPRQIMAIDKIHRDVTRRLRESRFANFEMYAALVEGLFIDTGLFALDEYGIPPELSRKYMKKDVHIDTLEGALKIILAADPDKSIMHPFEIMLINNLKSSIKII